MCNSRKRCHSQRGLGAARTKSWHPPVQAAGGKCTALATSNWSARSPSKPSLTMSRAMWNCFSVSNGRLRRFPRSITQTLARSFESDPSRRSASDVRPREQADNRVTGAGDSNRPLEKGKRTRYFGFDSSSPASSTKHSGSLTVPVTAPAAHSASCTRPPTPPGTRHGPRSTARAAHPRP